MSDWVLNSGMLGTQTCGIPPMRYTHVGKKGLSPIYIYIICHLRRGSAVGGNSGAYAEYLEKSKEHRILLNEHTR